MTTWTPEPAAVEAPTVESIEWVSHHSERFPMTIKPTKWRCIAIATLIVGSSTVLSATPASALAPRLFASTVHEFPSASGDPVELPTRGYISDLCLLADAPCLSFSGGKERLEATAQTKAIQMMSLLLRDPIGPWPAGAALDRVHWEVS
jgi:hypothetical protein